MRSQEGDRWTRRTLRLLVSALQMAFPPVDAAVRYNLHPFQGLDWESDPFEAQCCDPRRRPGQADELRSAESTAAARRPSAPHTRDRMCRQPRAGFDSRRVWTWR